MKEDWTMKRSIYVAAALLALAACSRETEIDVPDGYLALVASTEGPTRTVVTEGTRVYWEPDDEIVVFSGGKSGKFVSNLTSSAASATFTGTLGMDAWTEGEEMWAVYPYSETTSFDGEAVTAVLPAEQVARAGSFGKDVNLSVARSTTPTLQFFNVGGGIRFTLAEEGIQEIVLEGLDGEILAGRVKVGFQDGKPVVLDVAEGETSITLTPSGGGSFQKDTPYFFVAIPGALEKGFKLHFHKADDLGYRIFDKTVTIRRSIFGTLTHADAGAAYSTVTDENITFKDELVKSIVVKHFDTGGDGELSCREAAVVLSLLVDEAETRASEDKVSIFAGTGITTFDELVRFTGLNRIEDGVFAGCTELTSITIPENVTAIGDNAFKGCTGLESITITSETPPAIGTDAFADSGDCPILVPEGTEEAYLAAWSEYGDRIRPNEYPEPEAVDLGLPSGLKWASFNLGASRPEESGKYFAWAETEPKKVFTWENYKWCEGTYETLYKYTSGIQGNRYEMDPKDDAARVKLGGNWRIPSAAERDELFKYCSLSPETVNGVDVIKLTSQVNGNHIYLPKAGSINGTEPGVMSDASFWTASSYLYSCAAAGLIYESEVGVYIRNWATSYFLGIPIRPVSGDLGTPVESISVDKSMLTMYVGDTANLSVTVSPENATIRDFRWIVNGDSVVSVSSSGEVTALNAGKVSVYAESFDGLYTALCYVIVLDYTAPAVPEAIDLGLSSGLKWASFNLGASAPEEYGDYFAWGEVSPYYKTLDPLSWRAGKAAGYDWTSYKWSGEATGKMTKYCTDPSYGQDGFTDGKTTLDPLDDVVSLRLDGKWRMPTLEDMDELRKKCTWTWTSVNGVDGYRVQGPNGNSIFLPAAGLLDGTDITHEGTYGHYWTSSLYEEHPDQASNLVFESERSYLFADGREFGLSVRPVLDDPAAPEGEVVIWENNGTHGAINWDMVYRFGQEGKSSADVCLALFPEEAWDVIKTGTFYLLLEGPNPVIRVADGWWMSLWTDDDIVPGDPRLTDNGDGTMTLEINFAGNPIVDVLDEHDLLFTGTGYTPLKIYYRVKEPVHPGGPKVFWENDGTHGPVDWDGNYRFALSGCDYDGGALATFPESVWKVIRTGTFYLLLEGTRPCVRVTTGWWDVSWGQDIMPGDERILDNGDGTWTLTFCLAGDPILDILDEHNLLITGSDFTPLRLYYIE